MWWPLWQGLLETLVTPQVPQSLGQNLRLAAEAEMRCLTQGTREAEKAVSQQGTLNRGSPLPGGGCESTMTPGKMYPRCLTALRMNPEDALLWVTQLKTIITLHFMKPQEQRNTKVLKHMSQGRGRKLLSIKGYQAIVFKRPII